MLLEITLKKCEQIYKNFQEIESLLCYPEIIADVKYYKHLLKQKKEMENIVKQYLKLIEMKKQLESLQQSSFLDVELEQICRQEQETLQQEINNSLNLLNIILISENVENETVLEIKIDAKINSNIVEKFLLMYKNFSSKMGFTFEIFSVEEGKNSKNISILITGKNSFNLLKQEAGLHKVIYEERSEKKEHSIMVMVYPKLESGKQLIKEADFLVQTYRSSGAGGQHINTTDSAVRITHVPTGITASCQTERSQLQNRQKAKQMLISKISNFYKTAKLDSINKIKSEQSFENVEKVREYNFELNTSENFKINNQTNLKQLINGKLDEILKLTLMKENF